MTRLLRRLLAAAVTLAIAGCAMPASSNGDPFAQAGLKRHSYPPVVGPKVWSGGQEDFQEKMVSAASQYKLAIVNSGTDSATVVRSCYRSIFSSDWQGNIFREYVRTCLALDYMFQRDKRTNPVVRVKAAASPYFDDDAMVKRWTALMPYAGFANSDDMWTYARWAWSWVEPMTLKRLRGYRLGGTSSDRG